MFNNIRRPYKECSPADTISKIREILNRIDLVPEETFFANPYPQVFSVSINLTEEKGNFRANGKGRNKDYSLASAYAEFLERMQNGLFAFFSRTILQQLKKEYGFYYSPDEIYLNQNEFCNIPRDILSDLIRFKGTNNNKFISAYFERLGANKIPGIVSIPFYNTKEKTEIYLPFNLLLQTAGSNGMASGNTKAEALFQALSELLERWGAAQVFYKQLTPPTIPLEFLEQFYEEFEVIKYIERSKKYKITIKDFSAGKMIPALGIIVENKINNTYRLNVGADTSFQVALSRCLTEVYQGIQNEEQFDQSLLPIPTEKAEYLIKNDEISKFNRFLVFSNFTKDGSGIFPKSLFDNKPDYSFKPSLFTTKKSYRAEVHSLIKYFHKSGYNVYIRDVSFLNFPTVFVYIPTVSSQGRKNAPINVREEDFEIVKLDQIEPLFFNLESCSNEELEYIAQILGGFNPNISIMDLFNVSLKKDSPWKQINISFLLTLVFFKLRQFEKSYETFKTFLKSRTDDNNYYNTVKRYLQLKKDSIKETGIISRLMNDINNPVLIMQVVDDLSDPSTIFKFIKIPKCPNCNNCGLSDECITKNKISMARIVYQEMNQNAIDQKMIAWVS